MSKKTHFQGSDLHGFRRLAVDATEGLTDLVEAMHQRILHPTRADEVPIPTRGVTGLVYRSIRSVTTWVGSGLDLLLEPLAPLLGEHASSPEREAVLAALNGVLGDHLEESGNPLAIPMRLRRNGEALVLDRQALAAAIPELNARLLILVHGLCRGDLQWKRRGHDHGAALARDLGYTVIYLHYNSGRHISTNGREFSGLMETLVREWPVPLERLDLLGHSLGGLLIRSACHYAKAAEYSWMGHLGKIVFLGSPHHGAPLERGGHWVHEVLGKSPYVAPFARLGRIRSAGITDLRYGNLIDEDWIGRDRFHHADDLRRPVPLPKGVDCYTIAATTGKRLGDLKDRLLGDGLVPLDSALGRHNDPSLNLTFPKARQWIGYEMNHLDLLSRPEVYEKIQYWLE